MPSRGGVCATGIGCAVRSSTSSSNGTADARKPILGAHKRSSKIGVPTHVQSTCIYISVCGTNRGAFAVWSICVYLLLSPLRGDGARWKIFILPCVWALSSAGAA